MIHVLEYMTMGIIQRDGKGIGSFATRTAQVVFCASVMCPGRIIFFRTTFLFLTLKEDYKVHRIKLEHH